MASRISIRRIAAASCWTTAGDGVAARRVRGRGRGLVVFGFRIRVGTVVPLIVTVARRGAVATLLGGIRIDPRILRFWPSAVWIRKRTFCWP